LGFGIRGRKEKKAPGCFCREDIGLHGVNPIDLFFGQFRGNQVLLDGIRMYAIVYFCQISANIPTKLPAFCLFQTLELLYQVNLEFGTDPHSEFKCDILVCIGATVSSRFCHQTNCVGFGNPFFDTELVTVQTGLTFNYGEFAIIKFWIMHLFPYTQEFDGIQIS